VARFDERPELHVSVTHIQNFWIAELEAEAERLRDDARTHPMPGYVTMTMMARRSTFEAVGPFDESCGTPTPATGSCGPRSTAP
jgi:hypothetical protein